MLLHTTVPPLQCPAPAEEPTPQRHTDPMHQRISHLAEILIGSVITIATSSLRLLASGESGLGRQEMNWLLLPFIGALFAALCAYLFNPKVEDRRTIGGRVITGIFLGTISPNIVFYFSETLQKASVIPPVPLAFGYAVCGLTYILSKRVWGVGFSRADDIAQELWDKAESHTGLKKKGD